MPPSTVLRLTRALRHRNFRLFFAGQSIPLVGTWITRVATSWLIYRLTGSELVLGLAGFCGQIPTLLITPLAGVLVDRMDRRRMLVLTQAASLLQSAALAGLTLAGHVTVVRIVVLQGAAGHHQRLRHSSAAGLRQRDGRSPPRPRQCQHLPPDHRRRAPARPRHVVLHDGVLRDGADRQPDWRRNRRASGRSADHRIERAGLPCSRCLVCVASAGAAGAGAAGLS